jgi:hypothetical protein
MARTPRPSQIVLSTAAACVATGWFAGGAPAAEPDKAAPKESPVTFTFPAPAKVRARLTVTPGEPGSKAAAFKIVAGTASQTFTRAMPGAARSIEVPADPKTFVRFSVESPGAPAPMQALALITPDARPLLTADACGLWDLATSGGSASAACQGLDRHCPVASHASADRSLTLHHCGSGPVKFCVPDYKLEVTGEKGQKVRAGVEGDLGNWIPIKGPRIRRLFIPSGGACPGVIVESGSDRVRLSLGWGQRVLVRVLADGQITAEDLPLETRNGGGGGD